MLTDSPNSYVGVKKKPSCEKQRANQCMALQTVVDIRRARATWSESTNK